MRTSMMSGLHAEKMMPFRGFTGKLWYHHSLSASPLFGDGPGAMLIFPPAVNTNTPSRYGNPIGGAAVGAAVGGLVIVAGKVVIVAAPATGRYLTQKAAQAGKMIMRGAPA